MDINQVTKALTAAGVQATTADGQLINFATAIDKLGQRYQFLDEKTKNYVMTALGGTYQMNRLRALMDGYAQSVDLYNNSLTQADIANQKFNIYQESTQAKLDKLKASWEGFWQNSIDSSLIKGTLDIANKLVDTFGNLKTVVSAVATVLLLWKGTDVLNFFKTLPSSISSSVKQLQLFKEISAAWQLQEMGLLTTTQALGFSFKALGTSIKTAFLSNPLGWIALGITSIITAIDIFNQKQEEMKQKIEASANAAKESSDNISGLIAQYNQLNSSEIKDESSRQQLKSVQEQIVKLLGMEKDAIDLVNGSYEENIKKINEKSQAELKANQGTLQAAYNLAKQESDKRNIAGGIGGDLGNNSYSDSLLDGLKLSESQATKVRSILGSLVSEKLSTKEIVENLNEIIDLTNKYGDNTTAQYNKIVSVRDKYKGLLDKENSALADLNKNLATQGALAAQMKLGTPTKDNFQQFKESAVEAIAKQQGLNKVSDDFRNIIYDQIDSMFPQFNKQVQEVASSAQTEIKSFSDLAKEVKSTIGDVKDLNDIQSDLANGNKLSADSMLDLITKYPELLNYIHETSDGYTIEAGGIELVKKALIEKQITALKTESGITDAMETALKARLAIYGIELDSIKTLDDARNASAKLYSNIPDFVKQQVPGLQQSMTENETILESIAKLNTLKSMLDNGLKTPKTKTGGSTPSAIGYQDQSSEYLDTYNAQVKIDENDIKHLDNLISIADKQKDYNKELDLTNKKLELQKKTVTDLKIANDNISKAASAIKSGTKYNTVSWFDENGNATKTYLALVKSFEGKTDSASKAELANIEKIFGDIQKLKQAWLSNNDAIESMNTSLLDTETTLDSIRNKAADNIKSQASDIASYVSVYLDGLDNIMNAEEKAHNQKIKDLETEKKTFDDYIDDQLNQLDRVKEAQDYDKDVKGITDEIAKLQSQRNEYLMAANSGDLTAQSKVNDLNDQIAQKQNDLESKQNDRTYQLRKENLQNLKDTVDKSVEDRTTSENTAYQSMKDTYEKLKKDVQDYATAGINATAEMTTNIATDYETLKSKFTDATKGMRKTFDEDFIAGLKSAQTAIQKLQEELGKFSGVATSGDSTSSSDSSSKKPTTSKSHATLGGGFEKMSTEEFLQYRQNKLDYENGSITEAQKQYNIMLRKKYGIASDSYKYSDLVNFYATGSDYTNNGLSLVGEQGMELLNMRSGSQVISNADLTNMIKNISNIVKLPVFKAPSIPSLAGAGGSSAFTMGDIHIYAQSVDNNSIPKLANEVMSRIKIEFNKIGGFRPQ